MNINSTTLRKNQEVQPQTRASVAPARFEPPQLNTNVFSNEAVAFNTNSGVNQVLSEVLGAPADPADKFRSSSPVALEGYDSHKLNNPDHNTPKYIFGRVAQGFKLDSVQGDKGRAEELLKAMVPELKKNGLEVVDVKGDRIQVKTEVGYEWVDVVRGAGSDSPGWWWGSEGKGTSQPTTTVAEWAAATGQNGSAGAPVAVAGMGAMAGAMPSSNGMMGSGPRSTPLGDSLDRGAVMAILKKYPPTNEGVRQAMPELERKFPGVQLLEHPKRLDKLQFPNGAVVDVVVGAGGNNPSWGWMPEN